MKYVNKMLALSLCLLAVSVVNASAPKKEDGPGIFDTIKTHTPYTANWEAAYDADETRTRAKVDKALWYTAGVAAVTGAYYGLTHVGWFNKNIHTPVKNFFVNWGKAIKAKDPVAITGAVAVVTTVALAIKAALTQSVDCELKKLEKQEAKRAAEAMNNDDWKKELKARTDAVDAAKKELDDFKAADNSKMDPKDLEAELKDRAEAVAAAEKQVAAYKNEANGAVLDIQTFRKNRFDVKEDRDALRNAFRGAANGSYARAEARAEAAKQAAEDAKAKKEAEAKKGKKA